MHQSPSLEANWSSASQKIPHILWKAKVHSRIHKCPPPVRILSQINPVQAAPIPLPQNPSYYYPPIFSRVVQVFFPSGFPTKTLYTLLSPHTCYIPHPSHSSWSQLFYISLKHCDDVWYNFFLNNQPDALIIQYPSWLCLEAVIKTCMRFTSAECTVENSWWWAEKMPETCRVL